MTEIEIESAQNEIVEESDAHEEENVNETVEEIITPTKKKSGKISKKQQRLNAIDDFKNGVDVARFEKVYRMLIEDTLKKLPNLKIILCEPFVLQGTATVNTPEIPNRFERFSQVCKYAEVVKKLAKEYNLFFLPLQEKFNEKAKQFGAQALLGDGVHPTIAGATLIADEWLKLFKQEIDK